MLKIEVEISALSSEQREAVAGFIMTFPAAPSIEGIAAPIVPIVSEIEPEEAFGEPVPEIKTVSISGPHLVIPQPAATQTPNVPSVTAPHGGVNIDKAGLPWDDRIHAGSKTLTADGLWRKKRGVDDATVAKVETELRALMNIPAPNPVAAVPAPPAPVVEAAPVPAAVEVDPRQTFVALVGRASTLIQSGKLTQAELQAICNSVGVPSLPMLANRLDLVPSVNQLIDSTLASK